MALTPPRREDIGGDNGVVHLVPLVHGGGQGDSLLVKGLLNLIERHLPGKGADELQPLHRQLG